MMALKECVFGSLPAVTLDDLVPSDHFYRHLERTLDLAFVRRYRAMSQKRSSPLKKVWGPDSIALLTME